MLALLLAATVSVGSARLCARVADGACVGPVDGGVAPAGPLSFLTVMSADEPRVHVEHVWRHEGSPVSATGFTLESSPARFVSTVERLAPGAWSASVVDAAGRELMRVEFRVTASEKSPPQPREPVEPPLPEP